MHNPFEAIDRRLSNWEMLLTKVLSHLRDTSTSTSTSTSTVPETGGIKLAQEVTRLSKARLYALVSAWQIPHAKRGNKFYFTRSELLAWIMASKRTNDGK
jgi:hypothetical protein